MTKKLYSYFDNGVKVTVFPTYAPRPEEKTWKAASKYSIYQVGAQSSKLGSRRVSASCDKVK